MPENVLVSDTNIWIDLHRGSVLEVAFRLPYRFVTTDYVWRELKKPPGSDLIELGLGIEGLKGEENIHLYSLRQTLDNSSLADVSCYFVARKHFWTLLTGDGALRKSGCQNGIDVKGVLWILDEMENNQLMTGAQLAEALEAMLEAGARLPGNECQDRITKWRSS